MHAFRKTNIVKNMGYADLKTFLKTKAYNGQFVFTEKGHLSEILQKTVGDVLINTDEETVWGIEIKTERKHTGNLFIEEWSNRKWFTRGWLDHLDTDILWYYFRDKKILYSMVFPDLKKWAFIVNNRKNQPGRMYDFPAREQKEYDQPNNTWGRIVPIPVLEREIRFKTYQLQDDAPVDIDGPGMQLALYGGMNGGE